MAKKEIQLAGDGPIVAADVTKVGLLAIHRPPEGKGFVLTHVPSGRVVMRTRLQREAKEARRRLEGLDWADPGTARAAVEAIRAELVGA